MIRARRALWVALVSTISLAVFFVAVFPSRTFLAQRASTAAAEEQLDVLGEQNRLLEERIRLLNDDAEIERLAREEYHLVRPGEEAYALLPPPVPPAPPPPVGVPPGGAGDAGGVDTVRRWIGDLFR